MTTTSMPRSATPLTARVRGEADGLGVVPVEHKLRAPTARTGTVSRAGLIERLRAEQGDILVVTGPAGYGKTTFVAEWAEADRRPLAWLCLDAADNDPVVLVTYLALALDQIEPVDPSILSVLSQPTTSMATVLPRLARLIADVRRPFLLVIDDVHRLVAREALDVLAVLVADLPEGSLLAFAGRTLPAASPRSAQGEAGRRRGGGR